MIAKHLYPKKTDNNQSINLSSEPSSYPLLDWLRFVLASVVVLDHAHFQFAHFLTGSLAVSVFFALSGWLIGGILLRTDIHELPRFFFNRSTRIWIPYFVAIILLYSIAVIREGIDFFWLKYLIMDITFTHQLFTIFPAASYEMPLGGSGNQFWSIAVEEQFYLLAPLVMLFVINGKALTTWLIISAVCLAFGSNFGPISLGVCAAIMQRDYRIANQSLYRMLTLFLLLASTLALSLDSSRWDWIAGPIFSIALVVFLATPGERSKIALFFGGLSYPLYLNHWLALYFIHGAAKHLGLLELSSLPLISYLFAIGITVPLYIFIDRRISEHRNEWFNPKLGMYLGIISYFLVTVGIVAGTFMYHIGPQGAAPFEVK